MNQSKFAEIEKKILAFWKKQKVFKKSLKRNQGKKRFVFYEGPPFANAKPGLHHVLARSYKDIIARYKTMQGFYVERKAGWDTHGLPIEMSVEKQLGISSKKEIESLGIEKFIKACENNIFTHKKDFEAMTERMGYWLDLKNAYVTCTNEYMESVWWVLKQIWDKKLIYEDYRVVPYCARCGTTLSDHEVAQGYKETEDPSIFIKFKIKNVKFKNTSFLVWTTTPWTLPGNVAIALNPKLEYVLIETDGEKLILAEKRLAIIQNKYQILQKFSGKDLVGISYQPLFEFSKPAGKSYQTVLADFVSTDEGTGLVHTAPAFGAEDLELAKKEKLAVILNVDEAGKFKSEVTKWAGKFVKDADSEIINDLKNRNLLYKKETISHTYPFCWRCDSPLLYYAKNSWYIKTTAVKDQMIKENNKINWVPSYIKEGRFGNWLKENIDWTISRERYWGTPLPFWRCTKCQEIICIGSVQELREKAKLTNLPKDLHKPYIDEIEIPCEKCQGKMRRIPEVLDCWFDSGAMPYAQWHYPFENKAKFAENFPADFIAEGIDQTRGWFYTLLAISTLLDLGKSYKNVISLGLLLDEKGQKMSKSRGNVVETDIIFEKYSADAVRLYFYLSPLGETIKFSEKDLDSVFKKFIFTFWNSFKYFQTYSQNNLNQKSNSQKLNILDSWILSKLNLLIKNVTENLDKYEICKAARNLYSFVIDDLSNWYIRRSRTRNDNNFFQTLEKVIFALTKISAPFTPFISEEIYQKLKKDNKKLSESVHLEEFPKSDKSLIKTKLNQNMAEIRNLSQVILSARAQKGIKVRQPLSEVKVWGIDSIDKGLIQVILDEVNIEKIEFVKTEFRQVQKKLNQAWQVLEQDKIKIALNCKLTQDLLEKGKIRELVRIIQEARKKANFIPTDLITIYISANNDVKKIFENNLKEICQKVKAKKIIFSKKENITNFEFDFEKDKIWLGLEK